MVASTELIPVVTKRITQAVNPLQIILFGSHARGAAGSHSDLDLLVVVAEGADRRETGWRARDALLGCGIEADIVVTTPAKIARHGNLVGSVLRPALREGVLLYDVAGDGREHPIQAGPVSTDDVLAETRVLLQYAREDLALAATATSTSPRNACFLAQQAAEKALKAAYVFLQVQYPFAHNLDALRDGLPADWQVKRQHPDLEILSAWVVAGRYPEALERPLTAVDAFDARRQARAILDSITAGLAERGLPEETEP